ncbi:precorrin-2 dehydrogenase/sirohydrochlorin ferrochelatase [Desulfobaculum xiamenense]|uniref:precorrin-2 dehydrogenase n=1 Tax=Desulfobaculum xiamenense TaxID=995050 RepID=A0A846QQ09_9BACT|nr:bifunctional precorrin-2 dehydrogenase/sirohydrochlorin ferrochelatase [Desulfobaculum xiamenense]NJB66779.1 precorrin-2 dehydrogenase/sirohydrochlorin ferrochelatase [Desulfobaculum xiamenense]
MRHYPAFLNLRGRRCLVVGAGEVGTRKIETLLSCGPAEVLVVDTAPPSARMKALLDTPAVVYNQRPFEENDLEGRTLVFVCTNNAQLNATIGTMCETRGQLCNIADAPTQSGFIVPATFDRGSLVVALSTGGASPAVARRIRMELEAALGPSCGAFVELMGRIRPLVLELGMPTAANTEIFRKLAHGPLMAAIGEGDAEQVRDILTQELPAALHPRIGEVLDGIV